MSQKSAKPVRPTLRTVAERAGVSVAVVSYSFSRPERVAEATRQRVLEVARDLGYAGPNPAARALRTGKTGVIGFLFDQGSGTGLPPRVGDVTSVLLEACARRNISLTLPTGTSRPAFDGAIILRPAEAAIFDPGLPHVWIGPAEPGVENLISPSLDGVDDALNELRRLGHTRVAFLGDAGVFPACERQAEAYGPDAIAVMAPEETYDAGVEITTALLTGADRPTAIFAVGDPLAFGVRKAAADTGISVPQDLSLICQGNLKSMPHDISAVSVPLPEMGELALERLLKIIDGNEGGGDADYAPTVYRPGETVAGAPSN